MDGGPVNSPVRALLLTAGAILLALGLLWPIVSRYLGKLPGDVVVRREQLDLRVPDRDVPGSLAAARRWFSGSSGASDR